MSNRQREPAPTFGFRSSLAFALFSLLTGSLLLVDTAHSQTSGPFSYPRAQLLMEPDELTRAFDSKNLVVLDARPAAEYAKGHLPGARRVDHGDWSKSFEDGKDAAAWQEKVRSLGVDSDSQIVVYDDNAMKDAARIWWILRYWGVEDARLLNGGWKTWEKGGHPIAEKNESESIQPGDFIVKTQKARLTLKDQLLAGLPGGQWQVVDARSFDEHCGIRALSNERSGAIPGAKHLEWSDLIDSETDRFRSPAELRDLFAQAKIDLTRPTATHCQSGGRSSVMAFGMELMGAEEVSNYYRGWSEWGNAQDTPVETKPESETKESAP